MKRKLVSAAVVSVLGLLVSRCGHFHKVEHPEGHALAENERHAKIGSSEVSEGDRVEITKMVCRPGSIRPRGGERLSQCVSTKVGEAVVVAVVDEKTSIIRLEPGSEFSSELRVEKKK